MSGSAGARSEAVEAPLRGVGFLIAGISIFSFQDVAIKWLSGDYTVHEIMLVRSIVAVPAIVMIAWFSDGFHALIPKRVWVHVVRSVATFLAYTLSLIHISEPTRH